MKKIADISAFEALGNSSAVGPSSDMSVFNRCEESLSGSLFYFGDPCYAVPREEWQKFCKVLRGPGKYENLFCADYTADGDGVYGCNGDGVYTNVAVDSGMLGIVVLDDETKLQPGFMANLSSKGVIFRGSNVKLVADNGVFQVYSGGKLLFESDTREEDEDFSWQD